MGITTEHSTAYTLSAWILNGDVMSMEFNVPISGEILNQEIVNYKIDYFHTNEVVELTVELTTHLGNANLYIQRCFVTDCLINQDNIQNAETLSTK